MLRLSYWVFPIIAGVVWLSALLALLLFWAIGTHGMRYSSMSGTQNIAYISDVGADRLKPLFVTGCVLTTILLDISFGADRYLRHKGRLVPNASTTEKVLSGLTIFFAIIGTAGLILLSIFDTARHPKLHDVFLLFFIAGYVFSAIFICWEYQRLGNRYRDHRVLRISFWIKLVFVVVEILLAIAFVACTFTGNYNPGAVLEWTIAFIFSFYVFSFYVDLYPAVKTKNLADVSPDKQRVPRYTPPVDTDESIGMTTMRDVEDGRIEHEYSTPPPSHTHRYGDTVPSNF